VLQEFLACFKKERQGKVTQVKETILSFASGKAKVMPDVSTSSPSVTIEDVTSMLNDHTKHLRNHLHYMLENGLVKILKTLNPSSIHVVFRVFHKHLVLRLNMKCWKILYTACRRTSHPARRLRS
jgi:hypothetical protein